MSVAGDSLVFASAEHFNIELKNGYFKLHFEPIVREEKKEKEVEEETSPNDKEVVKKIKPIDHHWNLSLVKNGKSFKKLVIMIDESKEKIFLQNDIDRATLVYQLTEDIVDSWEEMVNELCLGLASQITEIPEQFDIFYKKKNNTISFQLPYSSSKNPWNFRDWSKSAGSATVCFQYFYFDPKEDKVGTKGKLMRNKYDPANTATSTRAQKRKNVEDPEQTLSESKVDKA
jgi:hypothetical protein